MYSVKNIEIAEYDYPLPDERIAKYPLKECDSSKLLVYNKGNVSEDVFRNLPEYIPAGSLMVFNNTKVIQARLLPFTPPTVRLSRKSIATQARRLYSTKVYILFA